MWLNKTLVKTLTTVVGSRHSLPVICSHLWPSLSLENRVRTTVTYKSYEKSRYMQKLLNKKGAKTKKHWYKPHLGESLEVESKKPKKGISHGHSVRLRQLSHVLYDKVTEIINTGELSQEILEKHVTITAIKVTKDMNNINVYWEADRQDWQEVEQLLTSHSGRLRSLLISYHVLGRIPHIVFVKGMSVANFHQLKELFDIADYGPDYVPGVTRADDAGNHEEDLETMTNDLETVTLHQREHDLSGSRSYVDMGKSSNDSRLEYSHSSNNSNDDTHDFDFEKEMRNQYHTDNDKGFSSNEYFNDNIDRYGRSHGGDTDTARTSNRQQSNTNCDVHFRSDLYGLNRDEMVKKIMTKKSASSKRDRGSITAGNSYDSDGHNGNSAVHPPLYMDINPKDIPAFVSPILNKVKLQKKLAKNDRKLREKLLEVDSIDL